ncbi:DUF5305 family protein [Thermococcus gorgonarius]|uniref:DUF5305 domain-containing protein n=1 Tax=Thermococcus gorgonarius TaxID=71997 RepID=A0A2Z2MA54_THEGO|nr:DUF5305 family protein [Thermococcus gorgonarius]ASJ01385.1 hypothetical protein A3K92_07775 [Thermococcus gorgonarius]
MSPGGHSSGFFFRKYGVPLAVFLFLIALYSAHAYLTTPTSLHKTRTVTQDLYSWMGQVNGKGIVGESNPLWPEGSLVSLPIYPVDVFPESRLEFSFNVSGRNVHLQFNRTLKVVYYIAYDKDRIFEATYATLSKSGSGSGFSDSITLNVTDLYRQLEAASSYLRLPKESAGVDVIGEVSYSGTVDGIPVKGNQKLRGEITFPYQGFYSIKGDSQNSTMTTSKKVPYTVRVNQKKRTAYKTLALVSAVGGVLSLGLWFGNRKMEIPEEFLEHIEQERKYRKWISRGRLENFVPYIKIRADTLEDLVNAAIDMNERVIYDESSGVYFFVKEGIMYYYPEPEGLRKNQNLN